MYFAKLTYKQDYIQLPGIMRWFVEMIQIVNEVVCGNDTNC